MTLLFSVLSTLAIFISAYAAIVSSRADRKATTFSQTLVDLEKERRHSELVPSFEINLLPLNDNVAKMSIKFVGPSGLDHLDKLTVSIREDRASHPEPITTSRTKEEDPIWGPFRFCPDVENVSVDRRSVFHIQLTLGDECKFQIEKTSPPASVTADWWQSQFGHVPIRLTFLCERKGNEPWTVPVEILQPSSPKIF